MIGNNKILFAGLVSLISLGSCNDNESFVSESLTNAPILGDESNAANGRLIVKFRENPEINKSSISDNEFLFSTGTLSFDDILTEIKANDIRRVFPVNEKKEDITIASGLHLWYVVSFDENYKVAEAAKKIASLKDIEKVEYSKSTKLLPEPESNFASLQLLNALNNVTKSGSQVTNDPLYNLQWSFNNDGTMFESQCIAGADVNVEKAWKRCKGDASIIVAVVDQGVMYDHPDLYENMWVNEAEELGSNTDADNNGYCGDRHGFNFLKYDAMPTYGTGHGTHVAGTIAAVNNNNEGVAGIAGGSGNGDGVKIMFCQISDEKSYVTTEREAEAIKYAADNGAVILQCSWGLASSIKDDETWLKTYSLEKEVLDYFIHNAGSANGVIDGGIVIFAAGNENKPQVGYPAKYKDYLAVTAIAPDYTPAIYTNYGPEADIAAPGGDYIYYAKDDKAQILSTMPPISQSNYEYYGYKQGTSMACPHVSGVVALGLSYASKLKKHFKASEFIEMIKSSTRSLDPYLQGSKIVNYTNQNGGITPIETKLNIYKDKMGALIDADKLLDAVENNGQALRIPNFTLGIDDTKVEDLSFYFVSGSLGSIQAKEYDSNIIEVSVSNNVITIKALKEGITNIVLSDGNFTQSISVIVRKVSANGSGWL